MMPITIEVRWDPGNVEHYFLLWKGHPELTTEVTWEDLDHLQTRVSNVIGDRG